MNVTAVTNDTGYIHHNLLTDTILRTRLWSAFECGSTSDRPLNGFPVLSTNAVSRGMHYTHTSHSFTPPHTQHTHTHTHTHTHKHAYTCKNKCTPTHTCTWTHLTPQLSHQSTHQLYGTDKHRNNTGKQNTNTELSSLKTNWCLRGETRALTVGLVHLFKKYK